MVVVVLSSHTSSLFWFRLDMMKDFVKRGHRVLAVGPSPEKDWSDKFKNYGIEYSTIFVERNGIDPIKDLLTLYKLYRFLRKENPDKVFVYQAKTIIYGCIAAKWNNITEVYPLVAGLGSIFRGIGIKNKIIKTILKFEYRIAFRASTKVFFQNNDDKYKFIENKLIKNGKAVIINGSGVNLNKFQPTSLPESPCFLFIGRLLKDKGIIEYLEACRKIKSVYPYVRCLIVGPYDSNPSAIKAEDMKSFIDENIIEYHGEQIDVRPFISRCSAFILPSYHEGTPKTVLEAMAMGRPIITTNAPGCRETVEDGVNGYLVNIKDVDGIVNKMELLIQNSIIGKKMGKESIRIIKEKYDVNIVNKAIINTMGL